MVTSRLLPDPFSTAATVRMPFASTEKVTSICGTPRGGGVGAELFAGDIGAVGVRGA